MIRAGLRPNSSMLAKPILAASAPSSPRSVSAFSGPTATSAG